MKPRHLPGALRDARKRRSLTLARVADLTGLNLSQISLIETGGVDPRLSSVEALASALDLTLALVPRAAIPAVEAMLAEGQAHAGQRPSPAEPPSIAERLRVATDVAPTGA
jgi:transcriptional regulator with XRE-family HTH domain